MVNVLEGVLILAVCGSTLLTSAKTCSMRKRGALRVDRGLHLPQRGDLHGMFSFLKRRNRASART